MNEKHNIGWREWIALPSLNIPAIKAKIDSGARTSALHTFELERTRKNNKDIARFLIHPLRKRPKIIVSCESEIIDVRTVKDSGGHPEERYIIHTPVQLNDRQWHIEISLTNREDMLFRMLLGRTAIIEGDLVIDPACSYLAGKHLAKAYNRK